MLFARLKACFCTSILATLLFTGFVLQVCAQEFIIEDIRVEGLQRLTPGTVFNYLPLEVGDSFNPAVSAEAVSALFKTGFFDDVQLQRDGNVLVIVLKERAAIGSIEISGNKDIKTEDLLDGLNQIGFAQGRVFDQSQLDGLERELRRQYFSAGKYAVTINSEVTPLSVTGLRWPSKYQKGKQPGSSRSISSVTSPTRRMIYWPILNCPGPRYFPFLPRTISIRARNYQVTWRPCVLFILIGVM